MSTKPAAINSDPLITMPEIRTQIAQNQKVSDLVRSCLGPTTMAEVYNSVEMTWASFKNAVQKGEALSPSSRGIARKGRYTGKEGVEVVSQWLRSRPNTREDFARELERLAQEIRGNTSPRVRKIFKSQKE